MIQSNWSQNLMIGLLAVILITLTWWGVNNGIKAAKSKRVVKDALTIKEGFEEFYKDQNRYPANTEFEDPNIMRKYITNYPPQEFMTGDCSKSFEYYSGSPQTFELRFCIPKSASGFEEGLNVLKP
jgi:hypothetical protein